MRRETRRLILASQTEDKLDPAKIQLIAVRLRRRELRQYFLWLRQARKQEKVTIEIALDRELLELEFISLFKRRFKDQELEFVKNPDLIAGLKVRFEDNVLDLSFAKILADFESEVIL